MVDPEKRAARQRRWREQKRKDKLARDQANTLRKLLGPKVKNFDSEGALGVIAAMRLRKPVTCVRPAS